MTTEVSTEEEEEEEEEVLMATAGFEASTGKELMVTTGLEAFTEEELMMAMIAGLETSTGVGRAVQMK